MGIEVAGLLVFGAWALGGPVAVAAVVLAVVPVVGAGLMGAGISAGGAEAGVSVRMKDATNDALARGLRYVRDVFDERLKRRSITRYEFAHRMDRVSATLDYSGFRRADLVIEAVFEDLDLKRKVLAEVEAATSDQCVFASNTSSLPICGWAAWR